MKLSFTIVALFLTTISLFAQEKPDVEPKGNKGKIYFYWGWNRGSFSNSNISFSGSDYNFTLKDVVADDRQTSFDAQTYLLPGNATIPQYNFRIGYFITDNYNISFGIDHMKYVMRQEQTVVIDGEINNSGTIYDGAYSNDEIKLTDDFLQFEHTDGLNYANISFRRFDEIYELYKIKISLTEGIGVGILYPKTNTSLLNKERYDEFHLAGYGLDAVVGVNLSFLKYFFIQSEIKGGYINMPNIRTTNSESDKASQDFFFSQIMIVFGASISL